MRSASLWLSMALGALALAFTAGCTGEGDGTLPADKVESPATPQVEVRQQAVIGASCTGTGQGDCDAGEFCVHDDGVGTNAGVCCDTACGGDDPNDCNACSTAGGASSAGTCEAITVANPYATVIIDDDNDQNCDGEDECYGDTDGDGFGEDVIVPDLAGPTCTNSGESGTNTDNCPSVANPGQEDADGDSIGDVCELDTDTDTIPDSAFAVTCQNGNNTSCDDNCINDANSGQEDADNDAIGDICEADTDTDTIPDSAFGVTCQNGATAGCDDNCVNDANPGQEDADNDAIGDICEADTDTDSIPDSAFGVTCQNGNAASCDDNCPSDPNNAQGDGDNDAIGDVCDNCPGVSNAGQEDADGDSIGDVCELDTDTDTIPDSAYAVTCQNGATAGCDDNCVNDANPGQEDADNDAIGDICEADTDTDGIPNSAYGLVCASGNATSCDDNCPDDVNPLQEDTDGDGVGDACGVDADNDTIPESGFGGVICTGGATTGCEDNCPGVANANQLDGDSDGVGDVCDNCPGVANNGQADFDSDTTGDVCDPDIDGDNALNGDDTDDFNVNVCSHDDADNCDDCNSGTYDLHNDGFDYDGDGLCDDGDPDDDNDGSLDAADSDDNNKFVCSLTDADNCDDCTSGTFDPANDGLDTDGDGLCNNGDPDDDNDGVNDGSDDNPIDPQDCDDADVDGCDECAVNPVTTATPNSPPWATFSPSTVTDGTDGDSDGWCDAGDNCPAVPNPAQVNYDGDAMGDLCDPDDDNDNALDGVDTDDHNQFVCSHDDADNCDDCNSGTYNLANDGPDFDGDGLCDDGDPDDDDDGALDAADSDDHNKFVCSLTDADNCDDCTSGTFDPANDGLDTDGDGLCNNGDPDDDNDGVDDGSDDNPIDPQDCDDADTDGCDECAVNPVTTATPNSPPWATFSPSTVTDGTDGDGDGWCDAGDNCPAVPNPAQVNYDGDAMGDLCDPDDDNDNALDGVDTDDHNQFVCSHDDADNCDDCNSGTYDLANDGPDFDGDGLCDDGDPDDDDDGALDGADSDDHNKFVCSLTDADNCDDCTSGTFDPANDGLDTDGDGRCNNGDPDDDNDGVNDGSDDNPIDPQDCADADSDGCDECGVNPVSTATPNSPAWATFSPSTVTDGTDADGDGHCATSDPCDVVSAAAGAPSAANAWQASTCATCRDLDGDGLFGVCDRRTAPALGAVDCYDGLCDDTQLYPGVPDGPAMGVPGAVERCSMGVMVGTIGIDPVAKDMQTAPACDFSTAFTGCRDSDHDGHYTRCDTYTYAVEDLCDSQDTIDDVDGALEFEGVLTENAWTLTACGVEYRGFEPLHSCVDEPPTDGIIDNCGGTCRDNDDDGYEGACDRRLPAGDPDGTGPAIAPTASVTFDCDDDSVDENTACSCVDADGDGRYVGCLSWTSKEFDACDNLPQTQALMTANALPTANADKVDYWNAWTEAACLSCADYDGDGYDGACDDRRDPPRSPTFVGNQDVSGDGVVDTAALNVAEAGPDVDCDDTTIHENAGVRNRCTSDLEDCDDTNAAINPGAVEICDGVSNNCGPVADFGELTNGLPSAALSGSPAVEFQVCPMGDEGGGGTHNYGDGEPCESWSCSSFTHHKDATNRIQKDCVGRKQNSAWHTAEYVFNTQSPDGTDMMLWMRVMPDPDNDGVGDDGTWQEDYNCSVTGVDDATYGSDTLDFEYTYGGFFNSGATTRYGNADCLGFDNGDGDGDKKFCWAAANDNTFITLDHGEHTVTCQSKTSRDSEWIGHDGIIFTSDLSYKPDYSSAKACDNDDTMLGGTCFGNWGPNAWDPGSAGVLVPPPADAVLFYHDDEDSLGDGSGDLMDTKMACSSVVLPDYVSQGDDCDPGDGGIFPAATEGCTEGDSNCDGGADEFSGDPVAYDGTGPDWRARCTSPAECGTDPDVSCYFGPSITSQATGWVRVNAVPPAGQTLTVNGVNVALPSSGDIVTVASALATAISGSAADVTATAAGSRIILVADTPGNGGNGYGLSVSTARPSPIEISGTTLSGATGHCVKICHVGGGTALEMLAAARGCDVFFGIDPDDTNPLLDHAECHSNGAIDVCSQERGFYVDSDSDGFGDRGTGNVPATPILACGSTAPAGTVSNGLDCDDGDAAINPSATEVCDGVDNDCDCPLGLNDGGPAGPWWVTAPQVPAPETLPQVYCGPGDGGVDEPLGKVPSAAALALNPYLTSYGGTSGQVTWYRDFDGDGSGCDGGQPNNDYGGYPGCTTVEACAVSAPPGYVNNTGDCTDINAMRSPLLVESCDGIDNDCDTNVDEGLPAAQPSALNDWTQAVPILPLGTSVSYDFNTHAFSLYYAFDDPTAPAMSETDLAGWLTVGTFFGTAHRTRLGSPFDEAGRYGRGVILGTSGWIDSDNPDGELNLGASFTLAMWVQPTASSDFGVLLRSGGNDWAFGIGASALAFAQPNTNPYTQGVGAFELGKWVHVAVSYDGSTLDYYVDGAHVGSKAASFTLADHTAASPFRIGSATGGFQGGIDEVMVWRRDLSSAEIGEVATQMHWAGAGALCASGSNIPCRYARDPAGACTAPSYCSPTEPMTVLTIAEHNAGVGYTVGDELTLLTGVSSTPAKVTKTSGGWALTDAGLYEHFEPGDPNVPNSHDNVPTHGGSGTGATFDITLSGGHGYCTNSGNCLMGLSACSAGSSVCEPRIAPGSVAELCVANGEDEDCDHEWDEPPVDAGGNKLAADDGSGGLYYSWYGTSCVGAGTHEPCTNNDTLSVSCTSDADCAAYAQKCYMPDAGFEGVCAFVHTSGGVYIHDECPAAPRPDLGGLQFCMSGTCQLAGACTQGINLCSAGVQICGQDETASAPPAEFCDGTDNDCDGAVDESNKTPPIGADCCTGPHCNLGCDGGHPCTPPLTCDLTDNVNNDTGLPPGDGLYDHDPLDDGKNRGRCVCDPANADADCALWGEVCNASFGSLGGTISLCTPPGVCGIGSAQCEDHGAAGFEMACVMTTSVANEANDVGLSCDGLDNDCDGIVDGSVDQTVNGGIITQPCGTACSPGFTGTEDVDNDGLLDPHLPGIATLYDPQQNSDHTDDLEDIDGDGRLDRNEDCGTDGICPWDPLYLGEDANFSQFNCTEDAGEDYDGDGHWDVPADWGTSCGTFAAGTYDGIRDEDVDRDGRLDVHEDANDDGLLDTGPQDGTRSCSYGAWGACSTRIPIAEECNNIDDDCDGDVDEDILVPCGFGCGMGTMSCTNGSLGACTAPMPETEICDGFDNDCDGDIDEGAGCGCQVVSNGATAGSTSELPPGTYTPGGEDYYFWSPSNAQPTIPELSVIGYHDGTQVKLHRITGADTAGPTLTLVDTQTAAKGGQLTWLGDHINSAVINFPGTVTTALGGTGYVIAPGCGDHNYDVGDTLTLTGGTGTPADLQVDSVIPIGCNFATGAITVTGSEPYYHTTWVPPSGWVLLPYPHYTNPGYWLPGTITWSVTIGGATIWGQNHSGSNFRNDGGTLSVASSLASAINSSGAPVSARAVGSVVELRADTIGSGGNGIGISVSGKMSVTSPMSGGEDTRTVGSVSIANAGAYTSKPGSNLDIPHDPDGVPGGDATFDVTWFLGEDTYWKVETDKPVAGYFSAGPLLTPADGATFFPAIDGKTYGRTFMVYFANSDQHRTRVYNLDMDTPSKIFVNGGGFSNQPFDIPAGGYKEITLVKQTVYTIEVAGPDYDAFGGPYTALQFPQVAVERTVDNGFTAVPPQDSLVASCRNDGGRLFTFATHETGVSGGTFVIFNPGGSDADVEIFTVAADGTETDDTPTSSFTLAPGAEWVRTSAGNNVYRVKIGTGPEVLVWAGSKEAGGSPNDFDDLGDDMAGGYGLNGNTWRFRSQTKGVRFVAPDGAHVIVDSVDHTLAPEQWLILPPGNTHSVRSDEPIFAINAGGNGWNDWGMALRPVRHKDTDGDGTPDILEGGMCDSIALDADGDGIPNFRDPTDASFSMREIATGSAFPADITAMPVVANFDASTGTGNDILSTDILTVDSSGMLRTYKFVDPNFIEYKTSSGQSVASPYSTPAVADLGGGSDLETVTIMRGGGVMRYDANLHDAWTGGAGLTVATGPTGATPNYSSLAIANLNEGGGPEIIGCHFALTAAGAFFGSWDGDPAAAARLIEDSDYCSPAVADVSTSPGMEVFVGGRAYNADGTLFWDATDPVTGTTLFETWGSTGYGAAPVVTDLSRDGFPEVVFVRGGVLYVVSANGDSGNGIAPGEVLAAMPVPGGTPHGGAPTVADFDGDRVNEIGVSGGGKYVVFAFRRVAGHYQVVEEWSTDISDLDGRAVATVFDFNGDGKPEIAFQDSAELQIFNTASPDAVATVAMPGSAFASLPVVADMQLNDPDYDGAQLIVPSATGVHIYQSDDPATPTVNSWLSTKRIFNEFGYHRTNIDDAGVVPANEAGNWINPDDDGYRSQKEVGLSTSPAADITVELVDFAQGGVGGGADGRVTNGLVLLYNFTKDDDHPNVVHDISGVAPANDLLIKDVDKVTWLNGGGLKFERHKDARVFAVGDYATPTSTATKLFTGVTSPKETGALTVETWIDYRKDKAEDGAPARLVTYASGVNTNDRNFELGLDADKDFEVRRRTGVMTAGPAANDDAGEPALSTFDDDQAHKHLHHVVYTRRSDGSESLYYDGDLVKSQTPCAAWPSPDCGPTGDFLNWDDGYLFGVGTAFAADTGLMREAKFYLLAVYNRDLTADEVKTNYDRGLITSSAACPALNRLTLNVCNLGDVDAGQTARISVFYGDPANGDLAAEAVLAEDIKTGVANCIKQEIEWLADRDGTWDISVFADSNDQVIECFEDNNRIGFPALLTPPGPDVCDGLDNDCNGLTDDAAAVVLCPSDAGCNSGATVGCTPEGVPDYSLCGGSPEICNGSDDDCDGVVDDVFDACGDGALECRTFDSVTYQCVYVQEAGEEVSGCGQGCPNGFACFGDPDGGMSHCVPSCHTDRDCPMGYVCGTDAICERVDEYTIDGQPGVHTTREQPLTPDELLTPTGSGSCSAVSVFGGDREGALGLTVLLVTFLGIIGWRRRR